MHAIDIDDHSIARHPAGFFSVGLYFQVLAVL